MMISRIGVLTSGGDAPGMNAAVRAIVQTAAHHDICVFGIRRGYTGLIESDLVELSSRAVNRLLPLGGTALYTARSDEMFTEQGQDKAALTCKQAGIDALVVIGGDGSFRGALTLAQRGVNVIGIPATIDNDIACTDYSIGFDTACNTSVEAVDKLRDTMQSHARCSVVEVMGRHAGHLALQVGIAVGATCVLVPERGTDIEKSVIEPIRRGREKGRHHHIIVVAEGSKCGSANDVASAIETATGIDARITILGHIQRGGAPSSYDRVVATNMGAHAVETLVAGRNKRIIASRGGQVEDIDMETGLASKKDLCQTLFQVSRIVTG